MILKTQSTSQKNPQSQIFWSKTVGKILKYFETVKPAT